MLATDERIKNNNMIQKKLTKDWLTKNGYTLDKKTFNWVKVCEYGKNYISQDIVG